MNSHNHLLKLSAFLIYIIQFTRSQINYDSDPLHFARLRLEEKLSSNLFLGNIVMDQEEDDASCSSEHGPFCSFINEKSLNYLERTTDDVYYHSLKNSTLRDLKDTIKYAKRSIGEKGGFPALKGGHEIIFYPTTRMRLDQALYPNNYPAVHTYTFTFQSFKTETGKLRSFDADVDFDLDTSMFIQKQLNSLKSLKLKVKLDDIYLQKTESILNTKAKKPKTERFAFLESDTEREKIMFGDLMPEENYSITLKDKPGFFKFSKPVFFRFLFLRKGSNQYIQSTTSQTAQNTENVENYKQVFEKNTEHYIIGRYKNKEIFRSEFDLNKAEWKRIYLPYKYVIDELEISRNTQIDNIEVQFNYTYFEQNLSQQDVKKIMSEKGKESKEKYSQQEEDMIKNLLSTLGVKSDKNQEKVLMISQLQDDGTFKIVKGEEARKLLEKMTKNLEKNNKLADKILGVKSDQKQAKGKADNKDNQKDDKQKQKQLIDKASKKLLETNMKTINKVQESFQKVMGKKSEKEIQKMLQDLVEGYSEDFGSDFTNKSTEQLDEMQVKMGKLMQDMLGDDYKTIQKDYVDSLKSVAEDYVKIIDDNKTQGGMSEEVKRQLEKSIDDVRKQQGNNVNLKVKKAEDRDKDKGVEDKEDYDKLFDMIEQLTFEEGQVEKEQNQIEYMKEYVKELENLQDMEYLQNIGKKTKKSKKNEDEPIQKIGDVLKIENGQEEQLSYLEPIVEYSEPIIYQKSEEVTLNSKNAQDLKDKKRRSKKKANKSEDEISSFKRELIDDQDFQDDDIKALINQAFDED